MRRLPATLTALLCLAFVFPGVASAARVTIPPNQAEADEYTEGIPDGIGFSAPDKGKDPANVLDQNELDQLDRLGETGADLATLAASTAPSRPRPGGSGSGSVSGSGDGPGNGSPSAAEVGNLTASTYVSSDDGMGSWLWIIVAIAVLSAAVYTLYLWTKGRRA
jgi:hypothetical protein